MDRNGTETPIPTILGQSEFFSTIATIGVYGEPPTRLVEMDSDYEMVSDHVRERVGALVENARLNADKLPEIAAGCLHQAGRFLDRNAKRPSEAWRCHGGALTILPGYRPALAAMRRLARRGEESDKLVVALNASVEVPGLAAETVASLVEKSAVDLKSGNDAGALDSLREAVRESPDTILPHLLKLGPAARRGDDHELIESLHVVADRWPQEGVSVAARMALVLAEERLGNLDAALEQLEKITPDEQYKTALAWLKVRLQIRTGAIDEAVGTLGDLRDGSGSEEFTFAVDRFRKAVNTLSLGKRETDESTVESSWEIDLVSRWKSDDFGAEVKAAGAAVDFVSSDAMKAALFENALLAAIDDDSGEREIPQDVDRTTPRGRALALALREVDKEDEAALLEDPEADPLGCLHAALTRGEDAAAIKALESLGKKATGETDRWDILVAQAAVMRDSGTQPDNVLEVLKNEATPIHVHKRPLASLIRLHDRTPESLASLALSQAGDVKNPDEKADLLSFAATHFEKFDPTRAAELHREALSLCPTCLMALSALEREGNDHATMAIALAAAAESSIDERDRAVSFIKSGAHYLASGSGSAALESFIKALKVAPGDEELRDSILRLAACHPEILEDTSLLQPQDLESFSLEGLLSLGALASGLDAVAATRLFGKAIEMDPEDPIALVGFTESALKSGRRSEESSRLLSLLRDASTPQEEAWVYLRIAQVDERYGEDVGAAMLSLMTLEEKLPGHRPTLGRLAMYYARQKRVQDLARIANALSSSLNDDEDATSAAMVAWRESSIDIEALRTAVSRQPTSVLHLAYLEARTEDIGERRACLEGIVRQLGESVVHGSRLADLLEEGGEAQAALELRRQALENCPDSLLDLLGMERIQEREQDYPALVETLIRIAGTSNVKEYQIAKLLAAARITQEQMNDSPRAAELCLEVLQKDPVNEEAFDRGKAILDNAGDSIMMGRLLSARVEGVIDPAQKHQLLIDIANTKLKDNDREGAKASLVQALSLFPSDLATHRWMASLRMQDEEWEEAIHHLMEAAKNVKDPETGMEVFYDLGVLYMDRSERKDLAEKSFVKVLGWSRDHFPAMERLGVLYVMMGNWGRAAQALERVIMLATDPSVKTAKMVDLARVLENNLNRSKDAERVVSEARRIDPLDIRPVEYLAGMYTRQNDPMALNVLLDQALTMQAAAIVKNPDSGVLYSNMLFVLTMKSQDEVASLAAAAMGIVGAEPTEHSKTASVESTWTLGSRISDPVVEGYICPKQVPIGMRATLQAIEEPVAKLFGFSLKQLGLGRDARVDRKLPLPSAITDLATAFGIKPEPVVYAGDDNDIRVIPGSPFAVIVPAHVVGSTEDAVVRFAAAFAVASIRWGISLATILTEQQLQQTIGGLVKLFVPDFKPAGLDPSVLVSVSKNLDSVLSAKIKAIVQPFAFDCAKVVELGDVRENIITMSHRAGFLSAGSLTGSVEALRAIAGNPSAPIDQLPVVGRMMSFIFSKDHLELRKRMGI